jgi:ABC-2 type transport system permease protein
MNQFKTVFKFEYFGYLKNKAFIVTSIVLVLLALALPVIPTAIRLFNRDRDESGGTTAGTNAAAVYDANRDHDLMHLSGFFGLRFEAAESVADGIQRVTNGQYQWLLEINEYRFTLHIPSITMFNQHLEHTARSYLREMMQREMMVEHGLEAGDISLILHSFPEGSMVALRGADTVETMMNNTIYAYILIFVLYFTLIMYGSYIMTSVITEKSSKAMELLITSAKPIYLMFGKVMGVAAAGLTQFTLFLLAGAGSLATNNLLQRNLFDGEAGGGALDQILAVLSAPSSPWIFVFLTLFFLLGFLLYAFVYAAFASTVNRMEEANSVMMLPMMLIIGGFLMSMMGLTNSSSPFLQVMSHVPFFTPMLMMMRYSTGSADVPEALISVAVLAASVVAVGYFSAKVYRAGVLMYGKPPKLWEIAKMIVKAKVN